VKLNLWPSLQLLPPVSWRVRSHRRHVEHHPSARHCWRRRRPVRDVRGPRRWQIGML